MAGPEGGNDAGHVGRALWHSTSMNESEPAASHQRLRRSSSIRSTRSTASTLRQPAWKSRAATTAPTATLSIVFAEPELGGRAALDSASSQLTSSTASTSPAVVREEDADTPAPLRGDQSNVEYTQPTSTSDVFPALSSPLEQQLTSKASLPNIGSAQATVTQRQPRPRTSSWFSSITRQKGKMAMRKMAPTASDAASVPLPDSTPTSPLRLPPAFPSMQAQAAAPILTPQEAEPVSEPLPAPPPPPPAVQAASEAPKVDPSPIEIKPAPPQKREQPITKKSWFSSPVSSPPAPRYTPSSPPSAYTAQHPSRSSSKSRANDPSTSASADDLPPPPPFESVVRKSTAILADKRPTVEPLRMNSYSSIDDRVPSLPPTPPSYLTTDPAPFSLVQSPPLSAHTPAAAMNPSTSRFSLSIPLLGRAKVPLGNVYDSSGQGAIPEPERNPSTPSAPTLTTTSSSEAASPTPTERPANNSSPPTLDNVQTALSSASDPQPPSPPSTSTSTSSAASTADSDDDLSSTIRPPAKRTTNHVQNASWWDYVGWSSSNPGQPAPSAAADPPPTNRAESQESVETIKANTEEAERTQTKQDEEDLGPAEVVVSSEPHAPAGIEANDNTGSVTTKNADGSTSTWFAPWSWYSGSEQQPNPSANATTEQAPGNGEEKVVVEQENVPAAETQKEPEPPVQAEAPQLQPEPSYEDPSNNPITNTFTSNKSGWASFFNSKIFVKSIGYEPPRPDDGVKRDENGMEVMDIPDDFDESQSQGQQQEPRGRADDTKDVGSTSPATLSVAPSISSKSSTTTNGDAHSIRSVSGRVVAAPAITVSEDLKKETAKIRAASHSASSTPRRGNSGTSTPISPSSSSSKPVQPTNSGTTTPTTTSTTTITKKGEKSLTANANGTKRTASPAPSTTSKKSLTSPIPAPSPPNLVLPTWQDTFLLPPRSTLPAKPSGYVDDQGVGGRLLGRTMKFVSGVLFARDAAGIGAGAASPGTGPLVGLGASDGGNGRKGKERQREGSILGSRMAQREVQSQAGHAQPTSPGTTESMLEREIRERFREFGKELPKAWSVFEDAGWDTSVLGGGFPGRPSPPLMGRSVSGGSATNTSSLLSPGKDVLRGCKSVVIIGIHGWFPGAMIRTVLGEPTGTSAKFANMMEQAVSEFEEEHGCKLDRITKIVLEGDGTIEKRVEKLYANLKSNKEWMSDLHDADAIIVATHSQGSIVSTHLLDRLIRDNHIVTSHNQTILPPPSTPHASGAEAALAALSGAGELKRRKIQRVVCQALCGIHLGPLRYLSSSTLVGPYIQYFESTAARELFEFQNTESEVSKKYVAALSNVLDHGVKMLYIASLNDQVVPIYSGLFTAASHPLILRALYIDGDAYHSSDFLSNLLVLLLRILNSGIPDSGLLAHLSEATAGSLNGVGHSTAYEEIATYSLAVKYLFLTNEGLPSLSSSNPFSHPHPHPHPHPHAPTTTSSTSQSKLVIEPFNALHEQNDYEIPWSLRDIIADDRVAFFFGKDISALRDAFRDWHPKTSILRDLKRKLQPITRLPTTGRDGGSAGLVSPVTSPSKL